MIKKLAVLGLTLIGLLSAGASHATWNADWKQRTKIGLNTAADGLPLATAVDSVPVLIRLHTGNFAFADAKADGSDLRFIAADDKTPLKHHIEKFDGLNELALVWVQLPKLAAGNKADFVWLYFANPAAAAGDDAKGSYDTTQALIYHFSEKETLPQDTTANANHATKSTAKATGTGVIGGGLAFDGAAELVLPSTPSLKSNTNGLTLSMWIKPTDAADAPIYTQTVGAGPLKVSIKGGKLLAQSGTLAATASTAIAAGAWQHLTVVVKDGLAIYLNGAEVARAPGSVPDLGGGAVIGKGYKGEIDELQISTTARSADWIKAAALSQGPDQKLVVYGQTEADAAADTGPSYVKILLSAVTLDGWIVIGILMVMFVVSVFVMIGKAIFVSRVAKDNKRFLSQFENLIGGVRSDGVTDADAAQETAAAKAYPHSQLHKLYTAGVHELRGRFDAYRAAGRSMNISEQSLAAIRATVDARLVRELQRLNSKMVLLTIAIAGGPFLGLLGTVVGVMITFAAIAAAGDVNVNAIAPGIAAALVATVAGLAVAIPALFGYNYLSGRINELTSDMQVFVDELTTRIAENHST